ncbi:hypothetical protein CR513_49028, partial [Mucuna pruriens]
MPKGNIMVTNLYHARKLVQIFGLEFSQDPRNVKLGLCACYFNPFGQYKKSYSCWLVTLTLDNLPPKMCKERKFILNSKSIKSKTQVAPYVWNEKSHSHLSFAIRSLILIVIKNFFHSKIHTKVTKIHSGKGLLISHLLLHMCLVLIRGIKLHTYYFPMSYKKEKKFLVMVLNITRRDKVYFGGYHIGKHTFYNITLMLCTQREMIKDTHNARIDISKICNKKELELKDIGCVKIFKPKNTICIDQIPKSRYLYVGQITKLYRYASNLSRCVNLN